MKIFNNDNISIQKPIVASIGFFDGVHLGHQFLIKQIKEQATLKGLPSAIITFDQHPRKVLQSEYQPALLCGNDEKLSLLAQTGLDYCVLLQFTKEMSRMTAKEFMQIVLKEKMNVDTLVIGYDHKFGHNRTDGFEQYVEYGKELGIEVIQAKEFEAEDHVSSSLIRALLKEGDIKTAAKLLSYNYTISGKIVEGFKVGRTIGFPTANIEVLEKYKVIPEYGVYAVHVHIEGRKYDGMLYIGKRPTLQNGENISVEVNIFDLDEDLYNKDLTAEFIDLVRGDEKFDGLEALKAQIAQDKVSVKQLLGLID